MDSDVSCDSLEYFSVENVQDCQCHLCYVLNQIDVEDVKDPEVKITSRKLIHFSYLLINYKKKFY